MITIPNRIELELNPGQIKAKTGLLAFFNIKRKFPTILKLGSGSKESRINGNFSKLRKIRNSIFNKKISEKSHRIYLFLTISIFFAFQISSALLFPGEFTIYNNNVSNLGNLNINPEGHWLFNAGVMITGVLVIPNFLYIYKIFMRFTGNFISLLFTRLSIISCISGSIGFFFIGVFSEISGIVHYVFATIAFGGFFTGAIILFFLFLVKDTLRKNLLSKRPLIFGFFSLYFQLFVIWISAGVFIGTDISSILDFSGWIVNYPFWEWGQFTSLILWTFLFPFFIKHNSQKNISQNVENPNT